MKIINLLISSLMITTIAYAEGSKDLFKKNQLGYRAHLMARGNTQNAQLFDPFPTSGVHKVYAKAGERIYAGSSVNAAGKVRIYAPNSTTAVATNTNNNGFIQNRAQELAGPKTNLNTSGYTALTYDVPAGGEGIYEVQFENVYTSGGTTLQPDYIDLAISKESFSQAATSVTAANALIAAWDVSVGTGANKDQMVNGRVYTTTLNLTGFNGNFNTKYLYSKVYVLTPQNYIYEVDNNGNNGASFNFFSNNKGIINNNVPTYKSLDSSTITSTNTIDPRVRDNGDNFTNKIFFNVPDTASFPANTAVSYSKENLLNQRTWLKGTVMTPEISDAYVTCDGNIIFKSNLVGRYQILLDANDNNSYNDDNDIFLTGATTVGTNTVALSTQQQNTINNLNSLPTKLSVKVTTAEVHFPFADMESNLGGIKIKRLGATTNSDIVYWDNSEINLRTGNSNNTHNGDKTPAPIRMLSGISSANGANIWGDSGSGMVNQHNQYGNVKTIDTWTFVYDEYETEINRFQCLTYSGNVWSDVNIDGTNASEKLVSGDLTSGANTISTGSNLYTYVVNAEGIVVSKSSVSNTGTYSLSKIPANSDVKVILATENYNVGQAFDTATLPKGWDYVSYKNNTASGVLNSNNFISITTRTNNISNFNIGIYNAPTPSKGVLTLKDSGDTFNVSVPVSAFNNIDQGAKGSNNITSLFIANFPANITSITIGTVTYTAANFPQTGINIPTNAQGVPSVDVLVNPSFEGRGQVVLNYAAVDAIGRLSGATGTATLNFTGEIGGSVWNDGNGNLINDTPENKLTGNGNTPQRNVELIPGGNLYAYLTDLNGNVLDTQAIAADGTYKFTNIATDQPLKVIISTTKYNVNQVATATLPQNWVSIGVNKDSATMVAAKAEYVVGVLNDNIKKLDFGVQQAPISTNNSQQLAANPRPNTIIALDNTVATTDSTLNKVIGSDKETATNSLTLKINKLPYTLNAQNGKIASDALLIYDGKTVNETNFPGLAISNFDSKLLAINMLGAGYTNVGFDYVFVDEAGANSPIYSYNIEWTTPLPLNLISFNAYANQNNVTLNWTTDNEHNMANFDVEYSVDGAKWKSLAIVDAVNLSGINNYSFEHNNVKNAVNIYRLRMNNTDLTKSYSKVAKVILNAPKSAFNIYPNPATDVITIDGLSAITTVKVVDIMGKVIITQNVTAEMITLDIAALVTGQYIIQLVNADQNIESIKFLKK